MDRGLAPSMLTDTASAGLAASVRATPRSLAQALQDWRRPEDIAAWASANFRFDAERALLFSGTHRRLGPAPTVAEPEAFLAEPVGICLDLARFAVETLRRVDTAAQARYLMVEFEPVLVDGHLLRLHWMASFRRGDQAYFFADSDRPGHVAGPYACSQDFIAEYQAFRGRPVLRHLELDSLQRPSPGTAAR
jgi:hypothetical protein